MSATRSDFSSNSGANASTGADYEDYDLPPGRRRQATGTVGGQAAVKLDEDLDEQLFDVPAFLRRQAD